jgi:hypothetical protein
MSSMLDKITTVVASREQVGSELGNEAMILNLKDGIYYGLDEIGVVIWRCIQTPCTIAAICEAIEARYAVEPDVCERDVIRVLDHLRSVGLVEIPDAPAA